MAQLFNLHVAPFLCGADTLMSHKIQVSITQGQKGTENQPWTFCHTAYNRVFMILPHNTVTCQGNSKVIDWLHV